MPANPFMFPRQAPSTPQEPPYSSEGLKLEPARPEGQGPVEVKPGVEEPFNPFQAIKSLMEKHGSTPYDIWEVEARGLLQLLQRSRKNRVQRGRAMDKYVKERAKTDEIIQMLLKEAQQYGDNA